MTGFDLNTETCKWYLDNASIVINKDLCDLKGTGIKRFPFCNLTDALPDFIDKEELSLLLTLDGLSITYDKDHDEIYVYDL